MTQNNIGIYASQISGHLWAPNGGMDALATTTVGSTSVAEITFAGIPQGYKHLQVRFIARTDMNSGGAWSPVSFRFNGDTAANYSVHTLGGQGGSTFSEGYANQTSMTGGFATSNTMTAGTFGSGVIDILDYTSPTKNKSISLISGDDSNGNGLVVMQSGAWFSTAAINSITFRLYGGGNGSNYLQHTQFALYGVK